MLKHIDRLDTARPDGSTVDLTRHAWPVDRWSIPRQHETLSRPTNTIVQPCASPHIGVKPDPEKIGGLLREDGVAVFRSDAAERMSKAARAWLESLDESQLGHAAHPWPSDEERHKWFYTPTDHGGLSLSRMTPVQQSRAMQVLASGLSRAGYVTATTVMGLENALDELEGWAVGWGRERGRDPQLYWLRVFGEPGASGSWAWRFGGHHLSVQHTVVDGEVVSSTPCFVGADPAVSPLLGGHLLRPLGAAEDLARDLVRSFDQGQFRTALLHAVAPVDLVTGNRSTISEGDTVMALREVWRHPQFGVAELDERVAAMHATAEKNAGVTSEHLEAVALSRVPKGLAAGSMTREQQEQLRSLLGVFIGRAPDDVAMKEAAKFEGDKILDLHFAWAGGVDNGDPHYYRVQGPRLLAEYDNTQRSANHIHSVWRDPDNDFGRDVLGEHLRTAHGYRRPA